MRSESANRHPSLEDLTHAAVRRGAVVSLIILIALTLGCGSTASPSRSGTGGSASTLAGQGGSVARDTFNIGPLS